MKKILIVDDEQDILDLLSELLKHKGYATETALDGIEALGHISLAHSNHSPFDLILLDIQMPKMDGMEVLDSIRKEEEKRGILIGKGTPIIMLTAKEREVVSSFHKGCDAFIAKPFDHKALLEQISKSLNK